MLNGIQLRGIPCRPLTAAVVAVGLVAGVVLSPAPLDAQVALRVETVRWKHPHVFQVAMFRVYWGLDPGVRDRFVEVSAAPQALPGVYSAGVLVPSHQTVYISVTAIGTNGLESGHSDMGQRMPASADPDPGLGVPGRPGGAGSPPN